LDLREEAHDEARRLGLLRRIRRPQRAEDVRAPRRRPTIPVALAKRCAADDYRFDVLVCVSLRNPQQDAFERVFVTISCRTGVVPWARLAGPLKAQAARAAEQLKPVLDRVVGDIIEARRTSIEPIRTRALAALHARVGEVHRQLASASRRMVQVGLFDQRALRASDLRDRARAALQDESHARFHEISNEDSKAEASYEVSALRIGRTC
jgi:hypothetical protein